MDEAGAAHHEHQRGLLLLTWPPKFQTFPNACETNGPSDLARWTRREQRIMSISGVFFCSRGPLFQTFPNACETNCQSSGTMDEAGAAHHEHQRVFFCSRGACETNCPSDLARWTRREQRIMSISGVFFCSCGPLSPKHFQTLAKPTAPVIWHDGRGGSSASRASAGSSSGHVLPQ